MGNVPISCCRSKSPRLQHSSSTRSNTGAGSYRNNSEYSTSNSAHGTKFSNKSYRRGTEEQDGGGGGGNQPSHNLQHISEREPDDSETDPSSNALNRPIFATRSSSANKNKQTTNNHQYHYHDSYSSSSNSNSRCKQLISTPLTSSQDHGYNSNSTSTNLTHYDGQLNDSFESSIQPQQQTQLTQPLGVHNECIPPNNKISNLNDNRLVLLNSITYSDEIDGRSSPSINRFDISQGSSGRNDKVYCRSNNLVKSSSCSTIFVDGSTISQPDLKQTIKCVSLAIYYHIKNRTSDCSVEIFDESIHPLKMPSSKLSGVQDELIILDRDENQSTRLNEPDQKTIYNFVKTLFTAAQLTSEYAITTLVYLERLMTYAEMDLTPRTWRRMFLGAIVLSSKVWEDQAVWNVDYAQILEEISVEDINELERQFLELIQFNMNVPSSVYAKYYFHLRTLALKNGLSKEHTLLTVGKATALEALSRAYVDDWQSSPIHRKSSPVKKRHTSLEKLRLNGQAKAVLM